MFTPQVMAAIKNDLVVVTMITVIGHLFRQKVVLKESPLFTPLFYRELAGTLVGFSVYNTISSLLPKMPEYIPQNALKIVTMLTVKAVMLAVMNKQPVGKVFSTKFLMNLGIIVGGLVIFDLIVKYVITKAVWDTQGSVVKTLGEKGISTLASDMVRDGDVETETPLSVMTMMVGVLGFAAINQLVPMDLGSL